MATTQATATKVRPSGPTKSEIAAFQRRTASSFDPRSRMDRLNLARIRAGKEPYDAKQYRSYVRSGGGKPAAAGAVSKETGAPPKAVVVRGPEASSAPESESKMPAARPAKKPSITGQTAYDKKAGSFFDMMSGDAKKFFDRLPTKETGKPTASQTPADQSEAQRVQTKVARVATPPARPGRNAGAARAEAASAGMAPSIVTGPSRAGISPGRGRGLGRGRASSPAVAKTTATAPSGATATRTTAKGRGGVVGALKSAGNAVSAWWNADKKKNQARGDAMERRRKETYANMNASAAGIGRGRRLPK